MSLFEVFWFTGFGLVVYHHVFYPIAMNLLSRNNKNEREETTESLTVWPKLTVIVPCYNEASVIVEKLHNLAFLDYPADRLRILLVDDGSTDETVALIDQTLRHAEFQLLPIELECLGENKGKVAALNHAMSLVDEGVVVLSDTSALISIDALRRAAVQLSKADVGVVCGTYAFLNDTTEGEQKYWEYQTKLKLMESQMGSTMGAHGALYAFRATDFNPLPKDTINDDFVLPMTIVRQGKQCKYDPNMIAVELESVELQQDFKRRQRIAAGNIQQALRLVDLLNPKHGWVSWNFASGKWLRAFMPFILAMIWFTSALNPPQSSLIHLAFFGQTGLYALMLARFLWPALPWPKLIDVFYYLVSAYLASGIGAVHYLAKPKDFVAWQRVSQTRLVKAYRSTATLWAKRCFDIVIATVAILLTFPLWPLIAFAIKLESPGPVMFRQLRIGQALPDRTLLFQMLKFRTMAKDAEAKTGAVWATSADPRITRVGKFLRKTRLDELPQLINVLKGDMSLVGPRPERPGIGGDLDRKIPFYAERTYFVLPGITGLAQVNQGYDTCLEDVKTKLLYDHAYALSLTNIGRWLQMDIYIAFKTVWVMVCGRGQ